MVDFNSLLNKATDDIERPKPLPIGSYLWTIRGHEFGTSARKQTPYVRFTVAPVTPMDDVDTALLAENWKDKTMRLDFYLTEDALFRLKDFFEKTLTMNTSGRTLGELIPEVTNLQFIGVVGHEISEKNPEDIYANITSYVAAA